MRLVLYGYNKLTSAKLQINVVCIKFIEGRLSKFYFKVITFTLLRIAIFLFKEFLNSYQDLK